MKTRTNQTIAMLVVASMVTLTTSQINTLSAGDIVLKKDVSGYHAYIVSYKKEGTGICLTYTDASCVETVSYDLVDGEWVYNSTDISPILTGDAVKQLLVGSYVRIMNAPASTTLTEDELNQVLEGCFVEGTFLTIKNPVFMPPRDEGTNYRGVVLGEDKVGAYNIVKSTGVITLLSSSVGVVELQSMRSINGKSIPSYPASTGTFVLKCIDGVLTWVAE